MSSDLNSIMNRSFEDKLLDNWLTEMQDTSENYQEPILEKEIIETIKFVCDSYKQNLQVFLMTIDITEKYIFLKELRREKVKDGLLTILVVLFISNKFFGGETDIKLPTIKNILYRLTKNHYENETILSLEREVLKVIKYNLPYVTIVDEFESFFEKYMREYGLKPIAKSLCINILEMLVTSRHQWFFGLKEFYKNEFKTFSCLMRSKFYLPASILLAAFQLTNYKYVLSLDKLLEDLKILTKIHPHHICVLSDVVLSLINN